MDHYTRYWGVLKNRWTSTAMAWMAAERTFWGQFLGSGRGGTVCLAMKVLFKNLEKLSGLAGDNARERLDLGDYAAY